METKTYLAHSVDNTVNESQYDDCAKTLASDKQVLSHILKHVLTEYQDYDVETIKKCIEGEPEVTLSTGDKIKGDNTESTIAHEGTIHYDIRFTAYIPDFSRRIKILLNLELQKDYYPGYDLTTRGIFYCARMLSEQLDTEFTAKNYDDIKKVYSIWICMNAPLDVSNTISSYAVARNNLYGNYTKQERYDILEMIMIRISDKEVTDQENELLRMLTVLFSHKLSAEEKKACLQDDYGMEMTKKVEGGIDHMSELGAFIREKAKEEGKKEGKKEGREEGREEKQKEIVQLVSCMVADNLQDKILEVLSDKSSCEKMLIKYNII